MCGAGMHAGDEGVLSYNVKTHTAAAPHDSDVYTSRVPALVQMPGPFSKQHSTRDSKRCTRAGVTTARRRMRPARPTRRPPAARANGGPCRTPWRALGSPLASPSSSQQTIPMNSQETLNIGSLLPAPPSPSPSRRDAAPSGTGQLVPQTPAAFDMNDYINVSPSPAVVVRPSGHPLSQLSQSSTLSSSSASASGTLSAHVSSSSQTLAPGTPGRFRAGGASSVGVSSPLRKSIDASALGMGVGLGVAGRRLFENEAAAGGTHRPSAGPLGSGIDLVRT